MEKSINYLIESDFNDYNDVICFIELVEKIKQDLEHKGYYTYFLYYLYNYNPDYLHTKYRQETLKKEYLALLNDKIYNVKNPLLQLKFAMVLLIEYPDANKYDIAKLIIKNTILFLDKLFFKKSYGLKENVLLSLDLVYKFNLDNNYKYTKKLKETINNYLCSKEAKNMNFIFINLFNELITRYKSFYLRDELDQIKSKLYEVIKAKNDVINTENKDANLQLYKTFICEIYKILASIDQSDKTNIYQKIIDINLLIADKVKSNIIKAEALEYAQCYALKLKDKKQISRINSLMRENSKNFVLGFKPIPLSLNTQSERELLEKFKNDVDNFLKTNCGLFDCVLKFDIAVDFKIIEQSSDNLVELLYGGAIYYDEDYLIANVGSNLFMKYQIYLLLFSYYANILNSKLLQKFYPTKEYFYSLVNDNNIIPKGYEEIMARMFYAGIHKDYMDFFIYSSVSIEAILRHIIGQDIIKNNKNNPQLQEYETLENLLNKAEEQKLLEENVVKELRLLFCREGFNIRNKVAHGRFSQDSFNNYCYLADYMWLFLMRFFIKNYHKEQPHKSKH